MIVDDRLDTVLRTPATGIGAARIRYRQLLDLLGRLPDAEWSEQHRAALGPLGELGAMLGEADRARVIAGTAIRSKQLVAHLAQSPPATASAAIGAARLAPEDWLALIPQLPVQARGFLRHRRDLGMAVEGLLQRFGIGDFALPLPEGYQAAPAEPVMLRPVASPRNVQPRQVQPDAGGIGAIVRRIEAFRRARHTIGEPSPGADPRLPFAEEPAPPARRLSEVQLRTDSDGAVVWADGPVQSLLWGALPFTADAGAPLRCDLATLRSVKARAPIRAGRLEIDSVEAIAGAWQIDAIPLFAERGGRFTGYLGRLRRPVAEPVSEEAAGQDRLRQLLHELRTPINAIQGFAELIQQQVFGPTPHEYRSLAASIAADAARILGGFEDVDRMVRLETGHLAPDPGEADLGDVLARLIAQLEPVVGPREVRITVERPQSAVPVGIEELDLERMLWRVLAVIGSAAQPGERLRFVLTGDGSACALALPLPAALAARSDAELFAPDSTRAAGFPSTAMLGSGFALRLAAAEAGAAGGALSREGSRMVLKLPCLTEQFGKHTGDNDGFASGSGEFRSSI